MLELVFNGAKFIALALLLLVALHQSQAAVDRWCDWCETLWEPSERKDEPPVKP